ncbi:MAG TPA: serine/threonine-protein kinase [Polyangiaceae bacterium]|nr:serine/threonine-protein kinase [Polyangiaceae bacterium]
MGPELGMVGVGETVAGKYRIERSIAVGGMGVVVAATHLSLGVPVALKFLTHEAKADGEAKARFAREAKAAAMIQSEHVCRVMDVGQLETGVPFIVMEYLEGRDLSQLIASDGPLPQEKAVDYVLEAGEALAEAHALGIVHRDIKPSNLFLARQRDGSEVVKILDFGISKLAPDSSGSDVRITSTRGLMGSPMYMAPEQIRASRDVDSRADVWAMGVVLYELLTGGPAFEGATALELFAKIVVDAPTPLSTRRRVPSGLEEAIVKCLEKDRERRVANIQALAALLEPFASEEGRRSVARIQRTRAIKNASATVTSSVVSGSAGELATAAPTSAAWGRTTPKPLRARRSLVIGGVVIAIALVALVLRATTAKAPSPTSPASVAASAPFAASAVPTPRAAPVPVEVQVFPALTATSSRSASPTPTRSAKAKAIPSAAASRARPSASAKEEELFGDRL